MERAHRFGRAIESWLLSPQVQFAEGPHRGGVAGWLDERGPVFLYPEITGYYLTWLAFLAEAFGRTELAARHSNEALCWISRQLVNGPPPTRSYLSGDGANDWRNTGSFAFDLAMLARGVASVRDLADEPLRARVLTNVLDLLVPFCAEGGSLQAFRPHPSLIAPDPPVRWSSSPGPHQAKVAAAILSANTVSPLPAKLHMTAEAAYQRWRDYSRLNVLDGEPHPALYHLEGLSLACVNGWDPDALSLARAAYLNVIGLGNSASPLAPVFNGSAGESRSDVLAQALRIGCILQSKACSREPELDQKLRHLVDTLRTFLADDGAMRFSHQEGCRHKNVWASLFTHQALSFYEVVSNGKSLPDRWLQLLV